MFKKTADLAEVGSPNDANAAGDDDVNDENYVSVNAVNVDNVNDEM